MKKGISILSIIILTLIMVSCDSLYTPHENLQKLDTKANQGRFLKEAPDMNYVKMQKKENMFNYKLKGKLTEFKELDIIKDVDINKNKINVNFIAKKRNGKVNGNIPTEDVLWENSLFLYYTIVDTFPHIEKIRLYSEYYFLDDHGNPYKEIIFISNIKSKVIKQINREYFRPEMLAKLVDHYTANYISRDGKIKDSRHP